MDPTKILHASNKKKRKKKKTEFSSLYSYKGHTRKYYQPYFEREAFQLWYGVTIAIQPPNKYMWNEASGCVFLSSITKEILDPKARGFMYVFVFTTLIIIAGYSPWVVAGGNRRNTVEHSMRDVYIN